MKIIRLVNENIKRISAIDITPDPSMHVIKIGGKNGNGKSSALDTISIVLGGAELCPAEPIREGETEGKGVLHLGEFVVTRKFKRSYAPADAIIVNGVAKDKDGNTVPITWGPTTSSLIVTNADGSAKFNSPQSLIDKLKSDLTFDPLAFSNATEKEQNIILRRIAHIDTTSLDKDRQEAMTLRTELNRQLKAQKTLLDAAKQYPDVPTDEIGAEEINRTLAEAEELRKKSVTAESDLLLADGALKDMEIERHARELRITELETQLNLTRAGLQATQSKINGQLPVVEELRQVKEKAMSAVPDVTSIQQKLRDIEDTNQKVRANRAYSQISKQYQALVTTSEEQTSEIAGIDLAKQTLLAEAQFPIEGLGLTADGVTFNGTPFAQAGSANQLRTSVAIGMALNPSLKVLRIDKGNILDEDSLKILEEMVTEKDYQIWMEWVTSDASQVAVMIEDGHIQ